MTVTEITVLITTTITSLTAAIVTIINAIRQTSNHAETKKQLEQVHTDVKSLR